MTINAAVLSLNINRAIIRYAEPSTYLMMAGVRHSFGLGNVFETSQDD